MASPAAIGFRVHSGWFAAVGLTGPLDSPAVIMRRRIEMIERLPAQPYHAAVGLALPDAQRVIAECASHAASLAAMGIRALVHDLRGLGHQVSGCGLLLSSGRALPHLEAILASHALIHTAEGELFRNALRDAVKACELPLFEIKEREISLDNRIAAWGKSIGPPWRQDQKLAAAAALFALTK